MGENVSERVAGIAGLSLLRHAIDAETAAAIATGLAEQKWTRWRHYRPFARQEFGYEYGISTQSVRTAEAIPAEVAALFPALREAGWTGPDPTQVIVNRYQPGGSISRHIDAQVFGPVIAAISLGTEWPVRFTRRGTARSIPMPVLSAYVMRGDARASWFHEVPACLDAERVSLTFRTLVPGTKVEQAGGGGRAARGPARRPRSTRFQW